MFRKFVLAAAAVAALGPFSLATSAPAAAKGKGFHHHHNHHNGHVWRHGFGYYGVAYGGCLRRVWTVNRFGESVLRTVNVCD